MSGCSHLGSVDACPTLSREAALDTDSNTRHGGTRNEHELTRLFVSDHLFDRDAGMRTIGSKMEPEPRWFRVFVPGATRRQLCVALEMHCYWTALEDKLSHSVPPVCLHAVPERCVKPTPAHVAVLNISSHMTMCGLFASSHIREIQYVPMTEPAGYARRRAVSAHGQGGNMASLAGLCCANSKCSRAVCACLT